MGELAGPRCPAHTHLQECSAQLPCSSDCSQQPRQLRLALSEVQVRAAHAVVRQQGGRLADNRHGSVHFQKVALARLACEREAFSILKQDGRPPRY